MLCKDIIKTIEKIAPLGLAYSWDNSGFLCGDINKEVKRVYITLDVNMYTVDEAVKNSADMIISHHPIMFGGIKSVDYCSPQGYVIKRLIENNIALYASHTPMDCAAGGINDALADKVGIINRKILEPNRDFSGCGLGRYGDLDSPVTLAEYAVFIKERLCAPFVRVCGNTNRLIKRAAVGGGACDDLIPEAIAKGVDVMVTSDMKYHISMDAAESGICVIDAGHYYTEVFVIDIFADIIKNCDVKTIKSTEKDVFMTV